MDEKKHKLIIDGNAFYEVDLECEKKKKEEKEKRGNEEKRIRVKQSGK